MRKGLFKTFESDAIFSEDAGRLYRYVLRRIWGPGPRACFCMLNPSDAGYTKNDPTTRICRQIATHLGFGGMYFVNEFAYRASEPSVILTLAEGGRTDIVGPLNNQFILDFAKQADTVICGWGVNGTLLNRHKEVFGLLRSAGIQPYCLSRTSNGQPIHPRWATSRTLEPLMVV